MKSPARSLKRNALIRARCAGWRLTAAEADGTEIEGALGAELAPVYARAGAHG